MKAILVINMPQTCWECPCEYDSLACKAKAGIRPDYDERPKECPLKPIPINETDIENAEQYSQLVNGIIDRMLKEKGRVNNE